MLVLAACATPAARIKRNQALFDSLPATEQALIREGKVAIGFTPDMVRLALGSPDRRWLRTDAAGQTEVWAYTTWDSLDGVPLHRGDFHRFRGGYPLFHPPVHQRAARAREHFRVAFSEGKVIGIEQETR